MRHELTNDADEISMPRLPGISSINLRRFYACAICFMALVLIVLLCNWAINLYTDYLWFNKLGRSDVFTKILLFKVILFTSCFIISGACLIWNIRWAFNNARGAILLRLHDDVRRLLITIIGSIVALGVVVSVAVLAIVSANNWETFILLVHQLPFGLADPQFGLDVTFYIVTLKALNFIQGWLLALATICITVSLIVYIAIFSVRKVALVVTPKMLNHIVTISAFLMVVIALNHLLDIYELMISDRGLIFGATYTDIHVRLPLYIFLSSLASITALLLIISTKTTGFRLVIGSLTLWAVLAIVGGIVFPLLFQRFRVDPDQFAKEKPFISRNLEATRTAYQLDHIKQISYPAEGDLDSVAIEQNRSTLDNIRIWDPRPLRDAYNQLQFMELYYKFLNIDSDRYTVDGRLRQVLIGARELDSEGLPADARNWVNRHLKYTHGYGVSMSPTTEFSVGEGRPKFFVHDIPIKGSPTIVQPELYYGESSEEFVIVNTDMKEVNPKPDFTRYKGGGGIQLNSPQRKFAHAWRFKDINILLSGQITENSQIQYRRNILHRVSTIAPFLEFEEDPYPVIDSSGKLWWLLDAYTISDQFPYSTKTHRGYNYIRNSVKIAVNAYDGNVTFYAIDPSDTLLQMYQRAFPSLFSNAINLEDDLRDHLRYPVGLFSAQAQMFLRYHVTEPQTFFTQSEQWNIPLETRIGKAGVQVNPSYLVMRLPDEPKEEFVLLLPFTPAGNKKNLVSLLVARNDWAHYGELINFQLPKDRQVDGPAQVEARIENDQQVSQQFTLWDGSGSQIIRGQLLVVPIADTILYAEPLYLQSEVLAFPELKKVILADNNNLVMADSIQEALTALTDTENNQQLALEHSVSKKTQDLAGVTEAINDLKEALQNLEQSFNQIPEP